MVRQGNPKTGQRSTKCPPQGPTIKIHAQLRTSPHIFSQELLVLAQGCLFLKVPNLARSNRTPRGQPLPDNPYRLLVLSDLKNTQHLFPLSNFSGCARVQQFRYVQFLSQTCGNVRIEAIFGPGSRRSLGRVAAESRRTPPGSPT